MPDPRVSLWICPSGRHVYLDRPAPMGSVAHTGQAIREEDGSYTPACSGYRACGDRRCRRVEYVPVNDSAAEALRELEAKLAEKDRAVHMYSEEQQRQRDRLVKCEADVKRLRVAVQNHLDTFGYDNHEGLADAVAGLGEGPVR